ncbi:MULTISPECIES: threonine-phosphate decarboxylase CobD [unclassified Xanthobacter]|uniref:threonine-phosphate decarboxylase CobD n=1 Tax=unclassified Xanthobacter TaxID=2623496 RepID=UPI001EFF9888|nr:MULTISPECIES: threonine-phosphate decarboxylase CobD [unclassified Xanthobacter]
MRDHGGDMDRAQAQYGAGDWLDLSTGINPCPYPVPALPPHAWAALPAASEIAALEAVAQAAYRTQAHVVALSGAQAAIQLVPRLVPPGRARVLGPTYNEHAAALDTMGWAVDTTGDVAGLPGADLAVVVNPNNPDGRRLMPEALSALAGQVSLLVVDESFGDAEPALSLLPELGPQTDNVVVLRSFGKFYGLAGVRLGFAVTGSTLAVRLRGLAGPWAVNGPAIAIGRAALADADWRADTIRRLVADARRLDGFAAACGWRLVGGTELFRTYETGDAARVRDRLARDHIWSRAFPWSQGWLRLGLPGTAAGWQRLEAALSRL